MYALWTTLLEVCIWEPSIIYINIELITNHMHRELAIYIFWIWSGCMLMAELRGIL